ncbi:hypothetical protein O9929_17300 [Vibrio lentus]|nr:hypothetical protein [Vibrio lentus]
MESIHVLTGKQIYQDMRLAFGANFLVLTSP